MKVLFLYPCWQLEKTVNHGITALSAYLKKYNHSTGLVYLESFDFNEAFKQIKNYAPELIAVSCVTNQWFLVKKFAEEFKKISRIPIVVGGPHINANPNTILETPYIDGACQGEGEKALAEYIDNLSAGKPLENTSNFYFNAGGKISSNPLTSLLDNLDELPFPDYDIFSKEVFLNYPTLSFSRGCPHSCSYCCNKHLRELYRGKGTYIRFKSASRAIEEISLVINKFNPQILNFDDDSFTKSRKWVFEFCDKYSKTFKLPFRCNARPEQLDEELIAALKKANCDLISIGIESGNENLRKDILDRKMSNESIVEAFNLCRKYGIKTSSFNMVGIPEETPRMFEETLELNKQASPDRVQLTIFYPYPGTQLGDYCIDKGYVSKGEHASSYFRQGVLDLPTFTNKQIKKSYAKFYWSFFKQKSILKALYFYFLKVHLEAYPYIWERAKALKRFIKKLLKKS